MKPSTNRTRRCRIGALVAVLAAAGCDSHGVVATDSRLAEGSTVTLTGSAAFAVARDGGAEVRQLPRWEVRGRVEKGHAVAGVPQEWRPLDFRRSDSDELAAQGGRAAASLLALLAVRDGAPRGQPNAVIARTWKQGEDEFTIGLLNGPIGLPEAAVLFHGDEPVTLLRYAFTRQPRGWQASAASIVSFKDGVPNSALVARVDDGEAASASVGGEALLLAGQVVERVRQSVGWKRIADAMVPPLHASDELGCWQKYLNYLSASSIMALAAVVVQMVCTTPNPVCIAAIIAYLKAVEDYVKALKELYNCAGYHLGLPTSGELYAGGGGVYIAWSVPSTSSMETKIKTRFESCYDLSCGMDMPAY